MPGKVETGPEGRKHKGLPDIVQAMHNPPHARHPGSSRAPGALARHGTFAAAAQALHKGHTAVLYALRTLEEQTELTLLDRRGYRTRLTPAGERVLEHCRKLLAAERELENTCAEIRAGWEPTLRIVFDGIFPAEPLLRVVKQLRAEGAGTRFHVSGEFLAGVEAAFIRDEADLMVSVLPPTLPGCAPTACPSCVRCWWPTALTRWRGDPGPIEGRGSRAAPAAHRARLGSPAAAQHRRAGGALHGAPQ